MKMTLARNLWFGFGTLILMTAVMALVILINVRSVDRSLTEMTTVEVPLSAAAYEMEINAIGTGMGVLKYLETGDPQHRARVEKDEADFERFKAEYDSLAVTPAEKAMGAQVGRLYTQYRALGENLLSAKDVQENLFVRVSNNFEKLDEILDEQIQANMAFHCPACSGRRPWPDAALPHREDPCNCQTRSLRASHGSRLPQTANL